MKKLNIKELKSIIGGLKCPPLCGNVIPEGAVYIGDCAHGEDCERSVMYRITLSCTFPYYTAYCTTGYVPPRLAGSA